MAEAVVIADLNQKGGVGKSTWSVHLAMELALRGKKVLLVDADPQHSALDWQASRGAEPLMSVVGIPTTGLHKEINRLKADYDFIVIDGPPRVTDIVISAIAAADVIVIPVQPSPYDVWAAKEIVKMISDAQPFKPNLTTVFLVNRRIVNTAIGRDVYEALAEYPFPILDATIGQRVIFAESAASGSTVMELAPDSTAASEVRAAVDKLLEIAHAS